MLILKALILNKFISFCDVPVDWQIGFQDPATDNVETMHDFHNFLISVFCAIGVLVFWMLFRILFLFNENKNKNPQIFTHASALEFVWTIIPAIILIAIAVPSFELLYSLEETVEPDVFIKIIGHQWYWSYELHFYMIGYGQPRSRAYDSYIMDEDDLDNGYFRLLEADKRLVLPYKTHIRLLITSTDVLHSWAVPSFGVKMDACPGRLSQVALYIKRPGLFYGQCSEICGVNHGFMPIALRVLDFRNFTNWMVHMSFLEYEYPRKKVIYFSSDR
jgi:cytochrome c oxidase subunit II